MTDVVTPEIPPQTVRLRDKDGEPVWVVISATPEDGLFIELSQPAAAQVWGYLRREGYRQLSQGPAGGMWSLAGIHVAVPRDDSDPMVTAGAVDRIAHAEGRPRHKVAAEMVALETAATKEQPGD